MKAIPNELEECALISSVFYWMQAAPHNESQTTCRIYSLWLRKILVFYKNRKKINIKRTICLHFSCLVGMYIIVLVRGVVARVQNGNFFFFCENLFAFVIRRSSQIKTEIKTIAGIRSFYVRQSTTQCAGLSFETMYAPHHAQRTHQQNLILTNDKSFTVVFTHMNYDGLVSPSVIGSVRVCSSLPFRMLFACC